MREFVSTPVLRTHYLRGAGRRHQMSTAIDYRQVSAKYYDDAYATKEDLPDLEFYVDMAKANGGPVLELACGTGRILLPIAREGISIHGVDNSLPMLNVLQDKLRQELKDVRNWFLLPTGTSGISVPTGCIRW